MVQPVSATVISADSSARAVTSRVPGASPVPAVSAIAVTRRTAPGTCGAATATPTSAVRSAPGSGTGRLTGRGVLTPGPSTRTVTGGPLARIRPAPALANVTRIS